MLSLHAFHASMLPRCCFVPITTTTTTTCLLSFALWAMCIQTHTQMYIDVCLVYMIPECIWDRCTLSSLLIKPVQRITKYPLLLKASHSQVLGGSTVTATRFHTVPGENCLITFVVCIELKYIFAVRQIYICCQSNSPLFFTQLPIAGRAQVHERAGRAHVLA